MTIKKACFVQSLSAFTAFKGQGLPEIAMVGKSNVGKSSLINNLTRNSKLARTSSEPGKTRLVNLYLINEGFFLVDLPGYGFAKAPKQERQKWAEMIEGYLRGSTNLKRVFQLVDIRHAPTEDDQLMVEYLRPQRARDLPHPGRAALGGAGAFLPGRHRPRRAVGRHRGRGDDGGTRPRPRVSGDTYDVNDPIIEGSNRLGNQSGKVWRLLSGRRGALPQG